MPDSDSTQVRAAAAHIQQRWGNQPRMGLILGTGLSRAAERMQIERILPYERIPHFVCTTALSHQGRLVCGSVDGVPVIAMAGRCHLYEGYSFDQVTLPVRVLGALGVKILVVSNASGGLNPAYRGGDIMVMADHINFMASVGGLRFGGGIGGAPHSAMTGLSMRGDGCSHPRCAPARLTNRGCGWCYDDRLIEQTLSIGRREGFAVHPGVYVAVPGPNFETRAEYRMFRRIGGDAVGMSTVPEVLTAASLGMRVLALSMVTNVALPDAPRKVDPQEVVELAARAEPNLCKIVLGIAAHAKHDPQMHQASAEPPPLAAAALLLPAASARTATPPKLGRIPDGRSGEV